MSTTVWRVLKILDTLRVAERHLAHAPPGTLRLLRSGRESSYTEEYLDLFFNGVIEDWYGDALGLPYHELVGPRRTGLGYAHVSADFAKPSSMGDVLEVAVIVRDIGRTSVKLTVHAFKDGAECVRATFVTVTTSLVDHKSIALPDDMRLALKNYQASCDASVSPASTSLRYGPSRLPA